MGWLTNMLSPENPSAPLFPESWLNEGSGANHAGIQLNELNSRSAEGVLACVRVISEALAAYPKHIYRDAHNGKRLVKEHPLYGIVNGPPNPQMTNLAFWVGIISQTCIWGNGYARLQRDGRNMVRYLWPVSSSKVKPRRDKDNVLYYEYNGGAGGGGEDIPASEMLHLPFLSYDGIQGYSPIQLRRQGLAISLAAERMGAMLFGKSARPSGILTTANVLKPEQKANLKQSFQEMNSGANSMGIALLEAGLDFKPLMLDPKDAQFLETRTWQLESIARDYRVPGHMIGILERATHSNAEQLALDFNTYTMLFWVQMVEQELDRKLFNGTPFYTKLDMDVFLRGDFATRMEGYKLMRDDGVLSADDINAKEGWPTIGEEAGGNIRIVPMNMISLEQLKNNQVQPTEDTDVAGSMDGNADPGGATPGESQLDEEVRRRFLMSFSRLFHDATSRTVNREKRDESFVQRTWLPVLTTMAESIAAFSPKGELKPEDHVFLADYTGAIWQRCAGWGKTQIQAVTSAEFNRAYTALSERL